MKKLPYNDPEIRNLMQALDLPGETVEISKALLCKLLNAGVSKGSRTGGIYSVWVGMMRRCYTVGASEYAQYGGRGVEVCERWKVFENFRLDVGDKRPANRTLDRINPAGPYSPENCRWASPMIQGANKRAKSRYVKQTAKNRFAVSLRGVRTATRDKTIIGRYPTLFQAVWASYNVNYACGDIPF